MKIDQTLWSASWVGAALNQWFHAVGIWHITTGVSLYVDGCIVHKSATPTTATYTAANAVNDLVLGRASNMPDRYGGVMLDEFYMYEYALPESVVSEVYWYYALYSWNQYTNIQRCY